MKLRFLLLAVAGIGMLASCSKDAAEGGAAGPDGSKSIVLKISAPQSTRAYTPDAPYTESTDIEQIDVYFTNDNGTILQSYRLEGDNLTAIRNNGLRFTGLENVTRVYCVANSAAEILSTGSLKTDFSAALGAQQPTANQEASIFVGYDDEITPLIVDEDTSIPNYDGTPTTQVPEEDDQAYTASVTIRPIVSRIEWGKITFQHNGGVKVTESGHDYFVVWTNWNPVLTGVYQSNVYLTSNIFADADKVSDFFATPARMDKIEQGAWAADLGLDPDAILAYSDYAGLDDYDYNPLIADLDGYNATADVTANPTECIPFHFFVPFAANSNQSDNTSVNSSDPFGGNVPHWHFQLQYESPTYTLTVYNYDASLNDDWEQYVASGTEVSDDSALKVKADFIYPIGPGNLAYANVVRLMQKSTTTNIVYQPGKIYTANIDLAPYNISSGFDEVTNYNVIVNVSVADFVTEEVTPGFN